MDRGAKGLGVSGCRTGRAHKPGPAPSHRPASFTRALPVSELKQSVTLGKTNSGLRIQDPPPVRPQSLARPALVSFRKPITRPTPPYGTGKAQDHRARPALKSAAREAEGAGLAPNGAGARGAGTSRPLFREGAKGPVRRDPGEAGAARQRRGSVPSSCCTGP